MAQTFYTVEDVARILRISEQKVRSMIRRKEIASIKVGSQSRISESALNAYIQSNTQ